MTNILFTRTTDSQSKVLKSFLTKNNVEFEERNLDTKQWTREDVAALAPDAMKIPQFIMGNVAIGGLPQTVAHFKANAPAKPAMPGAALAKAAMPKPGN
jgi:glutaredoxin